MASLERKTVLVIDDEQSMRHLITAILRKEGATVVAAGDGIEGLRKLYQVQPDVVFLDVMMPHMDGWQVLERIRLMTDVPVIMLTVLSGSEYEVKALRGGANDYITKPFDPNALLARAEAATRSRQSHRDPDAYDDGYLVFDRQRRKVMVGGKSVRLTRKEYELLNYLVRQNGRVCTYESILDNVWGSEGQGSAENVHVFVWQLRQKIEPDPRKPRYVVNVPSVGYVFGGY